MNETNPSAMTPAAKKRAFIFILTNILVSMIGVGIAWPVLPKLVQSMGSGSISEASSTYAFIGLLFALGQFVFSPSIGMLSDRYGRRPILLISLTGLAIDYLITALAPTIFVLALARLMGGIFGATVSTANAYIADITSPKDRAKNFGYLGAAFGLGFILGPALGGILGEIDIRLPFYVAAALSAINVVFGYFALPETLSQKNRRPLNLKQANPFSALRRVASFPTLTPLLITLFITAIAQRGLEAIWVLYTEFRFDWTLAQAAQSLVFVGVSFFLVQGFLVGPVVKLLGEWRAVITAYVLSGSAMLLFGLATQGWMLYPLIALYALGSGIGEPALKAICSKSVHDDMQGQLQGTLNSINAVGVIIGPFFAAMVLAHVSSSAPLINLPGAWFLFGAIIFAIAAMLTIRGANNLAAKLRQRRGTDI